MKKDGVILAVLDVSAEIVDSVIAMNDICFCIGDIYNRTVSSSQRLSDDN